jgi:SpoIIAA-like
MSATREGRKVFVEEQNSAETNRRLTMIEVLPQSQGKTLGVCFTGKATDEDYEKVFVPTLEKLIKEHGKIRCLYFMDEGFQGWELGAMWDDAKYGIKHRNDFEKIAVVGGPKWAEWATRIASHLVSAEIRTYSADQLDDAWSWVKA